jgi:hypothetical protein
MKISLLPFKNVEAFADIETREIFVSNRFISPERIDQNFKHEFAHILSNQSDHTSDFKQCLSDLGGEHIEQQDEFKRLRKICGIKSSIAANIGNISGIQNILTDYHLLQSYRKFSQKILGTEGHWEVINEGNSTVEGDMLSSKDQLIRLYPTPKGAFPVVVLYIPVITHFRSPQARALCYDMMLAEAKTVVGMARRKVTGMPTPDGGNISMDGGDLVQEGIKMKEEIIENAIKLGEPLGVFTL